MMEKSTIVVSKNETNKDSEHVVDDDSADAKAKAPNQQSKLDPKITQNGDNRQDEGMTKGRPNCPENKVDHDSCQIQGPPEKVVDDSPENGSEEKVHEQEWGLDKNLPPIKTRRDGQSCECSPSDLSPPSPKRMRQGSKEREDQWTGLWSPEAKK